MELCVCCYPSFELSVVSVGFLLIAERFWIFFHVTEDQRQTSAAALRLEASDGDTLLRKSSVRVVDTFVL